MKARMVIGFIALASAIADMQAGILENIKWQVEVKGNYRNSEEVSFPIATPLPPSFFHQGKNGVFLETPDAGDAFEISNVELNLVVPLSDRLKVQVNVDAIDLYDRNPTSSDHEIDLDSVLITLGQKWAPHQIPGQTDFYIQAGKFGKVERQNDRHLESYGLVSTSFNRFEDAGIEAGFNLGSFLFGGVSATSGNPLFFRDANSLAGDNGTSERVPPNPDPEYNSGVLVFYDAEVEKFDLDESEWGAYIGFKWSDPDHSRRTLTVMYFAYERELLPDPRINGTFYRGDLALLDGVLGFGIPVQGEDKSEQGLNVYVYFDQFTAFLQWIHQDLAGNERDGLELEISYLLDMSSVFNDRMMGISPVVRYSKLDPDFVGDPRFPAPSVWWEWEKWDIGVRIHVNTQWDLTIEFSRNEFIRGGREEQQDETLVTARYRFGN